MRKTELAKMIDHTLLGPTASAKKAVELCREAKKYGFVSVVLNPCHVHLASDFLKDSSVKVPGVITRMTWRSTGPLLVAGSPICSQMAIDSPKFTSLTK